MGLILSVLSNIMYLSEKFTMCLAAATVVSCLVLTLVMMLGLGVGLGYNYCFVEIKTKHRYVPGYYRYKVKEATTMQRTPPWRRLTTTTTKTTTSTATTTTSPTTTTPSPTTTTSPTIANNNRKQLIFYNPPTLEDIANEANNNDISMKQLSDDSNTEYEITGTSTTSKTVIQIQGLDLIALLSKLKAENRNYTLQIVT